MDALKAIACLLIVLHHLAAYGPMSQIAYPLFPGLIDGLYEYGRMAVQVFFVVAGFLFAGKHAPGGVLLVAQPIQAIKQRYFRLVVPYLAALILAIGCAAVARSWMSHDSIPGAAEPLQFLAHAFLMHDLLDQEALSAGVWYVAIDFQLFAVTVFLLWLSRQIQCGYPNLKAAGLVLITGLTLASLFVFNRDTSLDETAFYFFGSFGLGILIYWASGRQQSLWLLLLLVLTIVAALLIDFRSRIAVAGIVMLILGLARQYRFIRENLPLPNFLNTLGRISYSVFLVHFPLCLIVNATFFRFFPNQPITNAFGMILALCISILGGALFFRWVESGWNRPAYFWRRNKNTVVSWPKGPR
ncbi:acyltransferase [Nitrosospira sp. NpAV]|uniref:acyltransferase family protein n=1 Tax=Nitrosospira sp. NpAV TaxID=58133 RepID=UPI000A01DADC|nr:acyltransferase [Nitrosospira sp. NpAV]